MSKICLKFDSYYASWVQPVWRLCYVMARQSGAAQDLAFQAFLRLGASDAQEAAAQTLLFSSAVRQGEAYFSRKLRRMPRRDSLSRAPFPTSDALYAFLKLPFLRRCALCLFADGFAPADIAHILRIRPAHANRLCADPGIDGWQEALRAVVLPDGDVQQLSDRIYERFEVRSVGVENAIHDARQTFDRIAPWLALLVLAIFALSLWLTAR